ncbi:MAG: carbohydrate kinase [Hyphomicrobiales bacterium]|nr:carbohydrate kinase [Hyphomicrobiales bacterium]MDE2114529.1 carbohydrate kinase [Hyphomicrobiales bacterium]
MILVCGEALIDIFVGSETHDRMALEGCPGGSPFNVAFGLSRLGQKVQFLTGLSNDMMGERLFRFLRAEGVGEAFLKRSTRPTTLSLVDLTAGTPAYAFYGDGAADRDLTVSEIKPLGDDIRALHFGSFSTVVEPVGSALLALAQREAGRRLIAYDPNIRKTIEPDMNVWRAKVAELAACADVIKISDEDFEALYQQLDPAQKAQEWLKGRTSLVVLTRAGEGIRAWSHHGEMALPAPSIRLVDAVGAGDTFQAALLTALSETGHLEPAALAGISKDILEACLAFAIQAAGITCTRRGADIPRRAELPKLGH